MTESLFEFSLDILQKDFRRKESLLSEFLLVQTVAVTPETENILRRREHGRVEDAMPFMATLATLRQIVSVAVGSFTEGL
jgi:hypothetical protein